MKKLLILHILLFVFTIVCNAQMYSTSSYIQQRPGYNVYQTKTVSTQPTLGYSNGARIGYSTYRETYTPSRGGGSQSKPGGPRKVSGWGWVDWFAWGRGHGVPSSASNEDMEAYYNYYQTNPDLSYEDWYASVYGSGSDPEGPPSPGDPFADPIGNFPLLLLLPLVIGYCFYRKKKTVSV
jgi:hypothetical protein